MGHVPLFQHVGSSCRHQIQSENGLKKIIISSLVYSTVPLAKLHIQSNYNKQKEKEVELSWDQPAAAPIDNCVRHLGHPSKKKPCLCQLYSECRVDSQWHDIVQATF